MCHLYYIIQLLRLFLCRYLASWLVLVHTICMYLRDVNVKFLDTTKSCITRKSFHTLTYAPRKLPATKNLRRSHKSTHFCSIQFFSPIYSFPPRLQIPHYVSTFGIYFRIIVGIACLYFLNGLLCLVLTVHKIAFIVVICFIVMCV